MLIELDGQDVVRGVLGVDHVRVALRPRGRDDLLTLIGDTHIGDDGGPFDAAAWDDGKR